MLNAGVWIAVISLGALVMWAILWADRKLDAMKEDIDGLEGAFVDDVLDAIDDLVFPLSDWDREIVRDRVLGES
jgi:hypothetical protein